jgi:hypothetical protein
VQQAPRALAFEAETRRAALRAELARLTALDSDSPASLPPAAAETLRQPLEKMHKRLQRLCELCAATPGLAELTAVDRQHRATAKRDLPALEAAIEAANLSIELGLPPDLPASTDPRVLMEAWEVAADAALAQVETLLRDVETAAADAWRSERARTLRKELAALPPATTESAPDASDATLACALFAAAVAVREAWAAAHGDELCKLLDAAVHAARNDHSLRALWSDEPQRWLLLRQLFGIWGCTLLSLGNCFPAQRDAIERLVIDEAGQCHPTYAISGLLRCRSALIIGDVQQLEPVIDLGPDDDVRVIEACKLALPAAALEPYRVHSEARCSVQALADRAVLERPRLIDHFRCQPEIIAICDALCGYGLRVHTPREAPAVPLPFLQHPVSLIDVAGEQERLGGSWHNAAELAVTLELFQALQRAGVEPSDVAVITPYRGQLEQLRKQFLRLGIPIDFSVEMLDFDEPSAPPGRGVALGTVHRFQGGERSIVLLSSVVTRRASLGFLDQRENLLNVAISRARHRLIAIGQRGLLASGNRTGLLARAAQPLAAEAFREQLGLYA